jgi:hypothetical protein
MNILHHKSWHVRNKDNIKRVRRDEAKFAEEEKQKQERISIAESETRLNILRSKRINDDSTEIKNKKVKYDDIVADAEKLQNVNLFQQEELGLHNQDKNKEAELEKKKEQEKFEKKVGILQYLVDDEVDLKVAPWYKTLNKKEINNKEEIDLKKKKSLDPMTQFNKIIKNSKLNNEHHQKKDKKKVSNEIKLPKTMEQLRAERLKRESDERIKTQRLLSCNESPQLKNNQELIEKDDRKRKYNSQFNPQYSKY